MRENEAKMCNSVFPFNASFSRKMEFEHVYLGIGRPTRNFEIYFFGNKASYEQTSFYIFDLFSHVESPLVNYLLLCTKLTMFKYTRYIFILEFLKKTKHRMTKFYSIFSSYFYIIHLMSARVLLSNTYPSYKIEQTYM